MKFVIPEIGDVIKLDNPVTISAKLERRNLSLLKFAPIKYDVPGWIMEADWRSRFQRKNPTILPGTKNTKVEMSWFTPDAKTPMWLGRLQHLIGKPSTFTIMEGRLDAASGEGVYTTRKETCVALYPDIKNTAKAIDVVVPAGSELVVDRVYIRQGVPGLSSVTFKWPKEKCRFFVSIPVVARDFEFTFVKRTTPYAHRAFNRFGG